jgi:hypothetical protein
MRESILDQYQPAGPAIDEVKAASDRGAVAVDADDARFGGLEKRFRVAAGPEGGVDIETAVTRRQHLDGLTAEHGNMTGSGRRHPRAPRLIRPLPSPARRLPNRARETAGLEFSGESLPSHFLPKASRRTIKSDTDRPIPPQGYGFRPAFPSENPLQSAIP